MKFLKRDYDDFDLSMTMMIAGAAVTLMILAFVGSEEKRIGTSVVLDLGTYYCADHEPDGTCAEYRLIDSEKPVLEAKR